MNSQEEDHVMRYRFQTLSVGAVLALVAAGGGSGVTSAAPSAGDDGWAGGADNAAAITALYEEAVAAGEDQVVVYGAFAEAYQPLWDLFQERFPEIEVIGTPLSGAALHAKIDAEFASGRHEADVLMTGLVETPAQAEQDRLLSYEPVDTFDLPENFIDPENRYVVHFGDVYGVLYNTNEMSEDDLPTSLEDLTDERFSGMVMDEPLASALTDLVGIELHRSGVLDADTWRGILENAQLVTRTAEYYTQLTTGSIAMMPWASHTRYQTLAAAGAPVGFSVVPGMAVFLAGATGIVKESPHPNAAKVLQSWFLTPEAQNALGSEVTAYGLMPGAERPSEWPDIDELLEALSPIDPAGYAQARAEYEAFTESALAG
jgi:iron(III) transport system substrate-binding protein